MNSDFFQKLEEALAAERLDAYRQDGADELITTARYLWNIALCESLYSPLQMAEIALRNAIHKTLTNHASQDNWYESSLVTRKLAPLQIQQIQEACDCLSQNGKTVAPGKMVAELNFGFWTGFFNNFHASTGLAPLIAKTIFRVSKYERTHDKLQKRWGPSGNFEIEYSIMSGLFTGQIYLQDTGKSLKPSAGFHGNWKRCVCDWTDSMKLINLA